MSKEKTAYTYCNHPKCRMYHRWGTKIWKEHSAYLSKYYVEGKPRSKKK